MYGLVLEGGGAKGSYEIGVFKAIQELGIKIGAVTGTSVGALNGAFFAQKRFEEAYEVWYNMDNGLVLKTDTETYAELVNFDLKLMNMRKYYSYFTNLVFDGGLDISPLKELIRKYVDEDLLRNSDIDFGLVTVSLTDMKPLEVFIEDIPKGQIHNYLLASAYLPVFKKERLDGARFIDGGFHDNTPVNLIAKKGLKDIIVVRLKAIGVSQKPKFKDLNLIEIVPSEDLGSIMNFDKDIARKNMEIGYYDALRALSEEIEGYRYCLKNIPDEDYFETHLFNLSDNMIRQIAQELSIKPGHPKRTLFEKILPELITLCELKDSNSYRDLFIKTTEMLAEYYNINRLQIYEFQELNNLIHESFRTKNQATGILPGNLKFNPEILDNLPDMIRSQPIFKRAHKIPLLLKLLQIGDDLII
ncbi:MAG TPA: patatin-like phospholipase family protein [Thermotogota bacterium]|nr:patatin-like phospholipase family protein [Thermotogota bacterium]